MLGPVKMLRPVKMMGEQTARTTCESRSKLQNKLGWFGGSLSNINLTEEGVHWKRLTSVQDLLTMLNKKLHNVQ